MHGIVIKQFVILEINGRAARIVKSSASMCIKANALQNIRMGIETPEKAGINVKH